MSYATNLGKATALLTPDRGDFWIRKGAEDLRLQKQAEAKAKADLNEKLADIYDIDLKGGYLPAWGKAAKETYATYVNTVAELRAQDSNVSYAKLLMLKNETKSKIQSIKEDNDRVIKYLENPKYYKDAAWSNAAYTSDDFNDIAQYNNPTYYNVDPSTAYTYINPVEVAVKDIKYPTPTGTKYIKSISRNGRIYDVIENTYPENIESTIASELKSDPSYTDAIMWELSQDPLNRLRPNETAIEYFGRIRPLAEEEIDRRVAAAKPGPTETEKILSERGAGDGSGKKKKNYALEPGKIRARSETTGKMMQFQTMEKVVYSPQLTTLESDGNYIDYNNFSLIPSNYKGKSVSFGFKPDKIVIFNYKGKKTKFVRGNIVKSDTGEVSPLYEFLGLKPEDTKEEWTNTRSILVPYDEVSGLIEEHNAMDDVNEFMNTNVSYTSAQEQGIKNVMKDNNVSREEAIQALKDAGKL